MEDLLVADLFCGAGGSSTGAKKAVEELERQMILVCVNHWPIAIETHRLNHPEARHYVEDVQVADPEQIVPEGYLDLLMASPECKFYSRARGGKPVHDQGRMNPWAILRWLTALKVRCLLVENVPEFVYWGPLLPNGKPDPRRRGQYFQAWYTSIRKLGYRAEWRYLNAADYGDATTRVRFFMIARRDRKPIRWPDATHFQDGDSDLFGGRLHWRAAKEIIDWANLGRSLLDDPKYQRRPLSEKTRLRIAKGLTRFGGPLAPLYINLLGLEDDGNHGGSPHPTSFIMGKQGHNPAYRNVKDPTPTATTQGRAVLIHPTAKPFVLGQHSCSAPRDTDEPIPTIATDGAISLITAGAKPLISGQHTGVIRSADQPIPTCATHGGISVTNPLLVKYFGTGICHPVDEPLPTTTTKDRVGLASPMIVPYYGDHKGKSEPRAHSVDDPLRTISTEPRFGLANPVLVEINHGGNGDRSRSADDPLATVTSKRGTSLIQPFMIQWDQTGGNGAYVKSVDDPVPTIITKQNTGVVEPALLVEPVLEAAGDGVDPRRLVMVNGEPYVLDIRFRMLTNNELARAMGFTDAESSYEFVGKVAEVTKQIGNAVPVNTAKALVKAILG